MTKRRIRFDKLKIHEKFVYRNLVWEKIDDHHGRVCTAPSPEVSRFNDGILVHRYRKEDFDVSHTQNNSLG